MADNEENYDNINYKSICCEEIPELFLDKLVAKKHFSKFGKINRFILRPNRLSCTVEYETVEDAERAYEGAGSFNGHEFIINFAERDIGHVQNTEEWVDPEVQAELEAMNPSQRIASAMQMRPPMPSTGTNTMNAPKFFGVRTIRPPTSSNPPSQKSTKTAATSVSAKIAETPAALPKVDSALRMDLENLIRRPALTCEDKYRVLDARDKLIRMTTVRQTDIKKAVSTKGFCPDMCPEKERLMREFQRQVATFEISQDDINDTTISHRHAIKEYSRSSADQEVPLAHELRGETVLQMTMQYLMHHIMDLCDDPQTSLADWFHFVWDRTRSIRKDITQQELCSLSAVELVEQCARFHIHCAARLVAEDPSVFDKKINAENLTKCLQSLKYMYHDLRIKNVPCPCEAEFRSYIVLLNLGDANFLWELKQLPVHIQHSREVKRAIAFYNALQNNNYVHFFDMVRSSETSYLSACILLGYFYKLRLRAMNTIVKAYRKNDTLSLSYLKKMLGFEHIEAAATFYKSHGLQCDSEYVLLERLKKPDIDYTMDRAVFLVESKRAVSVGECVCGKSLQSADVFEKHQPHSSFEINGLLKAESWAAEDQLRGEAAAAKARERKLQQQTKQQQIRLPQVTLAPPPTIKTDINIFKKPQASPPISPKQQQQLKLQQQQQQQKQKQQQHQPHQPTPSIFGGHQPPTSSTAAMSNFKFSSAGLESSKFESKTDNSQLVFKTPLASTQTTNVATSVNFIDSIFKSNSEKPSPAVGGNIFGSATSGASIFGAAAKETANIFQQNSQKPPISSVPLSDRNDNIFHNFRSSHSAAVDSLKNLLESSDSITTVPAAFNKNDNKPILDKGKQLLRMRELEEEQESKQKQLEEARQKMRELEQRQAAVEAEKAAARKREHDLKNLELRAEHLHKAEMEALLTEEICEIAKEELSLHNTLQIRTQELTDTLLMSTVEQEIKDIVSEEYALMCHDQMILQRYFQRWLQHMREKQHQRKLMETTPIWVTTETRTQQTAKLSHPSEQLNLRMIKRYRYGEACDFKKLLWKRDCASYERTVDFFEIISKHALRRQAMRGASLQVRKYFKLLLTLPRDTDELPGFQSLCNKWLRKHVKKPAVRETATDGSEAFIRDIQHDVALCVRKISGISAINECEQHVRHECDHADGIICFMSCTNVQNTRKRLHHLLKLARSFKSVPVAFVVYDCQYDELTLSEILELESLQEEHKISAYKFFGCFEQKNGFHFATNLTRAARFVARESSFNTTAADALEMQTLENCLCSTLGEEMWQRWQISAHENPAFNKICTMPQHVIGLYHAAVRNLKEILVEEDLQEAPEFPLELREFVPKMEPNIPLGLEHFPSDWKNSRRQQEITKFLLKLKLPTMSGQPPHNLEDFQVWLLNYASLCIPQDDICATKAAYGAIKALIGQLNRPDLQQDDVDDVGKRLTMINYLPVVKMLVFAHINNILKHFNTKHLPKEVIYQRQALLNYRQQPWWLNYEAVEAVTVDYANFSNSTTDFANADAAQSNDNYDSIIDFDAIVLRAEQTARKADENLHKLKERPLNTSVNRIKHDLDESLYQFEYAKKSGTFDFSFVNRISDDIDDVFNGTLNVGDALMANTTASPQCRKRKHNTSTEMDSIMTKAFNLIEEVETQLDLEIRAQKALKLQFGELS